MDFLQSKEWRSFQESTGKKTFFVNEGNLEASVIEHRLPLVGKYFYIPRGSVISHQSSVKRKDEIKAFLDRIFILAQKNRAGWIRLDINSQEELDLLKNNTNLKIKKAPHDVQPKEVFVMDISKSEEELLLEMKSKTRYNIRLAKKKGVKITEHGTRNTEQKMDNFLRLNKMMAKRAGIRTHPEEYYRKMFEVIPGDILKLYVAKYEGKVVAADLVVFYEKTATYLHGASDNKYRNVMAPYLLKWQEIKDAKNQDCTKFDFGGISCSGPTTTKWAGITRFKLGFSKNTKPTRFLGSYDIILDNWKYFLYKSIQKLKNIL